MQPACPRRKHFEVEAPLFEVGALAASGGGGYFCPLAAGPPNSRRRWLFSFFCMAASSFISPPAPAAAPWRRWLGRPRLVQAVLFALAVLLYANTIPNQWAVDDIPIVRDNTLVQRGAAGIPGIFAHDAFFGYYQTDLKALTGGRWRPLSPALFALEAELLAPLKRDAKQEVVRDRAGYRLRDLSADTGFAHLLHLQNALLFGLLCVVLYQTLLQLLRPALRAGPARAELAAALAVLLFALHPLHTEVVANVKSCDELLSLLGALLALRCTLWAAEAAAGPARWRWLAAAAGAFLLALLAKETAVSFVAVVPLALWFFTPARLPRIVALGGPLLLVLGLWGGLRTAVVGLPQGKQVVPELMNDPFLMLDPQATYAPLVPGSEVQKLTHPTAQTFRRMPYANELATNIYTFGRYLRLLVWPHPLSSDYYPREIAIHSFADGSVWLALLLNAGLLLGALACVPRRAPMAFGILFYFLTFAIVSNLLVPVGTNMAERFLFVPSAGAYLVAALLLAPLADRPGPARTAGAIGLALACLAMAALTLRRNPQWYDNYTLFSHDATVATGSGKIKTDLAALTIEHAQEVEQQALQAQPAAAPAAQAQAAERQRVQLRDSTVSTTLPLLRDALSIHPMSWLAWLQLGTAHYLLAQNPAHLPQANYTHLLTALAALDQARFYQQNTARNRSIVKLQSAAYRDLGQLVGQQYGDLPHAIAYLEQARALAPADPQLYSLLGTAYSMQHDYVRAATATARSLALRPTDRETRENLALIYQQHAAADPAQRPLLAQAERLLRQVQAANRALPASDPRKAAATRRTLELLYKNYGLQGNAAQRAAIAKELLAGPPAGAQ